MQSVQTVEPVRPALRSDSGYLLSLATLSAVAASLTLLVYELKLEKPLRDAFLQQNALELGAKQRAALFLSLALAAAVPVVLSGLLWLFWRRRVELAVRRWGKILSPLCIAFWVPVQFVWPIAQSNPLMYLVMLSAFVFSARALFERSLDEIGLLRRPFWLFSPSWAGRLWERLGRLRVPPFVWFLVVFLGASAYTVYFSYYTIQNHRLIQTTAFDLGIYDNLMVNAMHGRFFRCPVMLGLEERSYLAGHAEYAMLLFVPFYAIKPHAETLLIIQSTILGFAAVPLFLFAKRFVAPAAAAVVSVAYLMFAPLHGPNFYDFHWLPIAVFFHFWLYYAIAAWKKWLIAATLIVLYAIREDVAMGLALLGVFLFLAGARPRFGIFLAVFSSCWFVINKFVLMPWYGPWYFEGLYAELFADGKPTFGSVVSTLLTNPVYAVSTFVRAEKLTYGLHMVAPLAFLPLQRLAFLLLLIPGAIVTLMTTGYWPTVQISFQYTTHWIPYLFLASVLALWLIKKGKNGKNRSRAALAALALGVLSHSYCFGAVLQRESFTGGFLKIPFEMTPEARERYEQLKSVLAHIPPTASVTASEYMSPHVSARLNSYTLRAAFPAADYIFLSNREAHGVTRQVLNAHLKEYAYGIDARAGEFYLFKKGHFSPETAKAMKQLGISGYKVVDAPPAPPTPPAPPAPPAPHGKR